MGKLNSPSELSIIRLSTKDVPTLAVLTKKFAALLKRVFLHPQGQIFCRLYNASARVGFRESIQPQQAAILFIARIFFLRFQCRGQSIFGNPGLKRLLDILEWIFREALDIVPAHLGLRALGHMGYFRLEARALWLSALNWLDARAGDTAADRGTLAAA